MDPVNISPDGGHRRGFFNIEPHRDHGAPPTLARKTFNAVWLDRQLLLVAEWRVNP
jgi:hypothetical protein